MNEGQDQLIPTPQTHGTERWRFIRDVVVFQLKMLLDNIRDFALMPVSLVAAIVDLVYKGGKREGALFYRVLRWGRHSEEVIDVYSAISAHEPGNFKVSPNYKVDALIARLEELVVREVEKGGTAASIKALMDRTIDEVNRGTGATRDAVRGAADKLRLRIDKLPEDGQGKSKET